MTCEECQDLLLLYVTGALEPSEEAAVRAHLGKGCPACAAALAGAEAAVHQLPLALPAVAAPAGAWEKIETRIGLEEPAETRDRAVLAAPFKSQEKGRVGWMGWAAAAVLAIVAGLAIKNASDARVEYQRQTADALKQVETAIALDKENYRMQAATYETQIVNLQARVDVLSKPAEFSLAAAAQADVKGRVVWDKVANTLTLEAQNVKPAGDGKTYELWIVTATGNKLAAGTAEPDAEGKIVFHTNLPTGVIPTAAAVTDEQGAKPDNGGLGTIQFLAALAKSS